MCYVTTRRVPKLRGAHPDRLKVGPPVGRMYEFLPVRANGGPIREDDSGRAPVGGVTCQDSQTTRPGSQAPVTSLVRGCSVHPLCNAYPSRSHGGGYGGPLIYRRLSQHGPTGGTLSVSSRPLQRSPAEPGS